MPERHVIRLVSGDPGTSIAERQESLLGSQSDPLVGVEIHHGVNGHALLLRPPQSVDSLCRPPTSLGSAEVPQAISSCGGQEHEPVDSQGPQTPGNAPPRVGRRDRHPSTSLMEATDGAEKDAQTYRIDEINLGQVQKDPRVAYGTRQLHPQRRRPGGVELTLKVEDHHRGPDIFGGRRHGQPGGGWVASDRFQQDLPTGWADPSLGLGRRMRGGLTLEDPLAPAAAGAQVRGRW